MTKVVITFTSIGSREISCLPYLNWPSPIQVSWNPPSANSSFHLFRKLTNTTRHKSSNWNLGKYSWNICRSFLVTNKFSWSNFSLRDLKAWKINQETKCQLKTSQKHWPKLFSKLKAKMRKNPRFCTKDTLWRDRIKSYSNWRKSGNSNCMTIMR